LNKLLGVPETNQEPPIAEPIDDSVTLQPQPEPQAQPNIKEEAAKEAVKALEGLFGR
jgi:hypothetical protein